MVFGLIIAQNEPAIPCRQIGIYPDLAAFLSKQVLTSSKPRRYSKFPSQKFSTCHDAVHQPGQSTYDVDYLYLKSQIKNLQPAGRFFC